MTYYHVITTDRYGDRVNTVAAHDAKDAIKVLLGSRHVVGTEPVSTKMSVYEKRPGDGHYNGYNTTMEQRLAVQLRETGDMLANCNVTIIPQKIIIEDIMGP